MALAGVELEALVPETDALTTRPPQLLCGDTLCRNILLKTKINFVLDSLRQGLVEASNMPFKSAAFALGVCEPLANIRCDIIISLAYNGI